MSTFSKFNFGGKKALVRVDFNVPLNEKYQITDDTRMRAAIPTIQKVLQDGGSVILMSHFGRPKEGPEKKYSLIHLVAHLQKLLGDEPEVFFAADCIGEAATNAAALLQKGDVSAVEVTRHFLARIAKIRCPSLVIWGQQDQFLPVSHVQELKPLLPHAQYELIDQCGHVPMTEIADRFNQITLNFLKQPV
jgi:pimeloyl-ACP methyl ester carboxylesterase